MLMFFSIIICFLLLMKESLPCFLYTFSLDFKKHSPSWYRLIKATFLSFSMMIIVYRKYALGFCLFILYFYTLLQINVDDSLKQMLNFRSQLLYFLNDVTFYWSLFFPGIINFCFLYITLHFRKNLNMQDML